MQRVDETASTCCNCLWFTPGSNHRHASGECHWGPPTAGAGTGNAKFPRMRWMDWCGRFERREDGLTKTRQPR